MITLPFHIVYAQSRELGPIQGPNSNLTPTGNPTLQVNNFISFLIGLMTIFGAIFFLFHILIGAYQWLGAGGNQNNAAAARVRIFQALLGLVILIAGYAIVGLVGNLFGIPVFNPLQLFTP